nr:MAG TPA: GAGA binding protein-like family [Caudoviricetes sp.]
MHGTNKFITFANVKQKIMVLHLIFDLITYYI